MFVTAAFAQEAPAETHTETGAAGHAAGEAHFPPFDSNLFASQVLWLAVVFVLFYMFMEKAVVPRIGGILENRRDRIASDLDEASRLKDESDAAVAAYEQELAEARNKASSIAQKANDKAKAEAEAERAEVEAELARKTEEAEQNIAAIKAKALGEVGSIAEDTTAAIVERLIGATVSKAEVASAISAADGK